jgi:hypothetical protein
LQQIAVASQTEREKNKSRSYIQPSEDEEKRRKPQAKTEISSNPFQDYNPSTSPCP